MGADGYLAIAGRQVLQDCATVLEVYNVFNHMET
jgi:hypothetical protein